MESSYFQYLVPFAYLIPAITAFSIGIFIRQRVSFKTKGIDFQKVLYYLCLAEGTHNTYYFVATLMRNFDTAVYEAMMFPLPWLFAQGIIAVTFSVLGFYFLRERHVEIGDIRVAKELAEKFRELSLIDPLTNLSNRRALESTIEKEKVRADRMSRPFAVMMIDLDKFKEYNDSHGHQMGDHLLVSIADYVKANIRKEIDTPFRYGGDELFVIMSETTLKEARVIGERLKDSIKALTYGVITVSIGIIEITPRSTLKTDEMIRQADRVMYDAKKGGGDRIACMVL